jgi:hypothetical protein
VLVTELAAVLRMPERSAENLVAESELLVHDFSSRSTPCAKVNSATGTPRRSSTTR